MTSQVATCMWATRQRLRGTVGPNVATRGAGPHDHLERTATPNTARRLHRPLPTPPTPPIARSSRASRLQRDHGRTGPTHCATHPLRRTHQRIRHRRLNPATNPDDHDGPPACFNACRRIKRRTRATRPDQIPTTPNLEPRKELAADGFPAPYRIASLCEVRITSRITAAASVPAAVTWLTVCSNVSWRSFVTAARNSGSSCHRRAVRGLTPAYAAASFCVLPSANPSASRAIFAEGRVGVYRLAFTGPDGSRSPSPHSTSLVATSVEVASVGWARASPTPTRSTDSPTLLRRQGCGHRPRAEHPPRLL